MPQNTTTRRTLHTPSHEPEDRARYMTSEPAAELQLLDVTAVARLLSCSPRHVHRLVEDGRMPVGVKVGALRRFRRDEILNWIRSGCPGGAQ